MFQYRQVLMRLRAGNSVREIARSGLMGRDKLSSLRQVALQHGWLAAFRAGPFLTTATSLHQTAKGKSTTGSGSARKPRSTQIRGAHSLDRLLNWKIHPLPGALMAISFEQVQQWVAANGIGSVGFTLVRTQGDGRVGYLPGNLVCRPSPNDTEMAGHSLESFSDRQRNIKGGSGGGPYPYVQPFDHGVDANGPNRDPDSLKFRRLGPNQYELEITFTRWTQQPETITMTVYPGTMVYTGVGSPIGGSPASTSPHALYVLSLEFVDQYVDLLPVFPATNLKG